MVRRWSFPFGMVIFQGRAVKLQGCNSRIKNSRVCHPYFSSRKRGKTSNVNVIQPAVWARGIGESRKTTDDASKFQQTISKSAKKRLVNNGINYILPSSSGDLARFNRLFRFWEKVVGSIITQLAVYAAYIPGIYGPYHLLPEPEESIDRFPHHWEYIQQVILLPFLANSPDWIAINKFLAILQLWPFWDGENVTLFKGCWWPPSQKLKRVTLNHLVCESIFVEHSWFPMVGSHVLWHFHPRDPGGVSKSKCTSMLKYGWLNRKVHTRKESNTTS